jgi:hypothetical protein
MKMDSLEFYQKKKNLCNKRLYVLLHMALFFTFSTETSFDQLATPTVSTNSITTCSRNVQTTQIQTLCVVPLEAMDRYFNATP